MADVKIQFLNEAHSAYMDIEDRLIAQARIISLMHQYGIDFKEPRVQYPFLNLVDKSDVCTLFFEAIYNDKRANDAQVFAVICETHINMSILQPKIPHQYLSDLYQRNKQRLSTTQKQEATRILSSYETASYYSLFNQLKSSNALTPQL